MAHRAEINDCENCNEKDVCEVSNMMNNYGLRCKMFSPYRPLTNADRIRGMTDEELADELLEWFACFMAVEWTKEMILGYLKQEVESNDS